MFTAQIHQLDLFDSWSEEEPQIRSKAPLRIRLGTEAPAANSSYIVCKAGEATYPGPSS